MLHLYLPCRLAPRLRSPVVLACNHFRKRQAGAGPLAMNSARNRSRAESASYNLRR
jgi:hypothetical protein